MVRVDCRRGTRHVPRSRNGRTGTRQGHEIVSVYDGRPIDGNAARVEVYGEHLSSLRSYRQSLLEGVDGRGVRGGQLQKRHHVEAVFFTQRRP